MRCPGCGNWNPETNRYCGHCGRNLGESDPTSKYSVEEPIYVIKRCPNCESMISDGDESCSKCGIPFSEDYGPLVDTTPLETEKIKPYPYIVWKFPFVIFETSLMSWEQFIFRSIFAWVAVLVMMITFISAGFWQGAVLLLAVFSIVYIVSWKKGVEEAIWYRK
jgi:uncharacterized membrane protein YvbJ